jgi:hypothetical protein
MQLAVSKSDLIHNTGQKCKQIFFPEKKTFYAHFELLIICFLGAFQSSLSTAPLPLGSSSMSSSGGSKVPLPIIRDKKSGNSYSAAGDDDINDVAAMGGVNLQEEANVSNLVISVANPDPPDPHVFGPPGYGSTRQRYGSGSFYHRAKIVRKTFIPTILCLLLTFYL